MTATLLSDSVNAKRLLTILTSVFMFFVISTNLITDAGLKKCHPVIALKISYSDTVKDNELVFVSNTVSSEHFRANNSIIFLSKSSIILSIFKSLSNLSSRVL